MSKNTLVGTPATIKQVAFLSRLLNEKQDIAARLNDDQREIVSRHVAGSLIGKDDASFLIGALMRLEDKPRAQAQPGYYVEGEKFVVVVTNRAGTNTYAKVLEVKTSNGGRASARWTYAPGVGRDVAHLTPMTLEQAATFGRLHGVCLVCCRALTDPESVLRGIGPVCAGKFGVKAPKVQKPEAAAPTVNVAALKRRKK